MPGASFLARIGYTKSQKNMRTKTINTEVLNNSSIPQQIIEDQTVAPPLPPRSPGETLSVLGENSLLVVVAPEDCDNGAGEVSLPGAPSLHTHSSKFPIEREVIVRSGEKQCKIPILADYMRRAKSTVAPDVPQKQIAWTHQMKSSEMPGSSLASGMNQDMAGHQVYKAVPVLESSCGSEPSPIRPLENNHTTVVDSGPATSTPEENARGLPSRTYRSLKEMVTKGFSNHKSAADTSLSPQSQLRQAGVYLQPQPVQYRTPQQTHQQPPPTLNSNDGYRVYPLGNYNETPRRDLSKAPSHDNLLSQDNRYRQEGNGGGSQTVYMQQQEQRVLYGAAGPSRLQYLYSGQQTPDNRFNYPDPSRNTQYGGPRHFNYSPEQLATQRRHFAEQQRHNELQQQRLLGERIAGEGQQQLRPGDGGGGGGGGGAGALNSQYEQGRHQQDQQHMHIHQQQQAQRHHQQQHLELPASHYNDQQRYNDQTQGVHYGESRQISENYVDNQRQTNEQQQLQQNELKTFETKQSSDQVPQQNAVNSDEKNINKLDQPKPSSPEDDDEGGFVKRGAQSDSGRGSTVYSSVKANPTSTVSGEKGEEWSERVETELRQILSGSGASSESLSSVSPPLPPLSPPASSGEEKPKYSLNSNTLGLGGGFKSQSGGTLWVSRPGDKSSRMNQKPSKSASNLLASRLEIDSMLDENNSSDDELDYADTRLIRKQLEGLESMYGQVLKLLKARRQHGYDGLESGLRHSRRRTCGSVSSVPSSVSSRPIRVSRSQPRGKIRDFKGINKRFQRLESHVVTLARSVAHLSSEMRTQHLMMQEMEVMRGELAALRIQSNAQQQQQQQQPMILNPGRVGQGNTTTPDKVKRLTKFFGDEPPLLRLFLRGLGYEKYASLFEKERIGLLELPYLTEDRLHKLGIPLGPRLRILQQAHLANPNTLAVL